MCVCVLVLDLGWGEGEIGREKKLFAWLECEKKNSLHVLTTITVSAFMGSLVRLSFFKKMPYHWAFGTYLH